MYVIDLEGNEYPLQATSTNEKEVNGNQSLSTTILATKVNKKFISDIKEMWRIVDHDNVEHKIIYAKRKGVGRYNHEYEEINTNKSIFYYRPTQPVVHSTSERKLASSTQLEVEIKAIPLFFDDFDNDRIYDNINKHMTAIDAFTTLFNGTNYDFVLVDRFDAVQWEGFGAGETRLETFKRCLERYKCEFRISGNVIYLERQIGRDTQFQYRHRLNSTNIEEEIDADEMWTYAKGYGDYGNDGVSSDESEEDWENAKLIEEYTSPLADIIGIRHAPPIKDGRITRKAKMQESLKELVDESLKVSVSADVYDLQKQGYPVAQSEVGDRVFLIDERIGLDDEVRVISQSKTRNWKGDVIDLNITFGSEGIEKRHRTQLSTAVKDIQDLISGRKKLPYSVLPAAEQAAMRALKEAQTELIFGSAENGVQGIIAQEKGDPNRMVWLNSAGWMISTDGGATSKVAATADGIVADVITAGTINTDQVAIYGGDGKSYTHIDGATFESRGQFTRTFFDETKTHDVRLRFAGGLLRAESMTDDQRLYYSNDGIFTYYQGSNEDDEGYAGSGVIEFFSHRYDEDRRGLTLYSNRGTIGIETATRDIVLNANRYLMIENDNLYTDRIHTKASATNFYVGVDGENDGELRVTNKYFWQGSHADTRYMPIRAIGVHGKWFVSPDNFLYLGSDAGVRVTSRAVNNNDPIIYRDIQAKDFVQRSSKKSKENIQKCTLNALEVVKQLEVKEFNYVGSKKRNLGFIAEDSPTISDGEFISHGDLLSTLTIAIQQINDKLEASK